MQTIPNRIDDEEDGNVNPIGVGVKGIIVLGCGALGLLGERNLLLTEQLV